MKLTSGQKNILILAAIGGVIVVASSRKIKEVATDATKATTTRAIRWSSPLLYKDVYEYLRYKTTGQTPSLHLESQGEKATNREGK